MLKHFLAIACRAILRRKFYSLILTLGLALGIASFVMLGMYTWHELSYDNFHQKKERIFLVGVHGKEGTEEYKEGSTTPPTGPALKDHFPEIENFTRLALWFDEVVVSKGDKKFIETGTIAADSSVFEVFTIPFLEGNPKKALTEPNSIVITKEIAEKYFAGESPIGQTLHFDHFFADCKITGVVENYPDNSHFDFGILLSLSTFRDINFDFSNSWGNHTFSTYVLLNEKANAAQLNGRMQEFIKKQLNAYLIQRHQKSYEEVYKAGDFYNLFLEPLSEIHLGTLVYENQEGKKMLVYALGLIGVIILVLVCINYTNLSSVLSLSRAKEVGIRKAAGGRSESLFRQFLIESIILAFAGLFLGLCLIESLLPFFNTLTNKSLRLDYLNPFVAASLIIFTIVIGTIAGFYPALTFARFNPIRALKGDTTAPTRLRWLGNGLVIFQFTVCIIMTVSAVVVYRQLAFMTNKNVGFSKDQVVVVKRAEGLKADKSTFKKELLKSSGIISVSYTQTTPGRHFNGQTQHFAGRPSTETPVIYPLFADEDILQTLDIELINGNSFQNYPGQATKAILNETAVNDLGLKNPLAEKIDRGTMGNNLVDIIGVVKDFHFKSFHHSVEPLVIFPLDVDNDPHHNATFILIKIDGKNITASLTEIESHWKKLAGNYPFEYSFMDDDFNKLFERENTMARVYTIFSGVSIGIAALGLLGLTSFFASKRTKEIGIRKIVGATVTNIAFLLSRQFLQWFAIALVVGSTISWYLMNLWLENFAYKTQISAWVFMVSGGSVFFIALLTISWQLHTAASRNPAETLKYE
jgi:putative ABC transport system permease protein